ncbi:hypothetical protein BH11ARM1_BH11ARM1_02500 [soil metagenome]
MLAALVILCTPQTPLPPSQLIKERNAFNLKPTVDPELSGSDVISFVFPIGQSSPVNTLCSLNGVLMLALTDHGQIKTTQKVDEDGRMGFSWLRDVPLPDGMTSPINLNGNFASYNEDSNYSCLMYDHRTREEFVDNGQSKKWQLTRGERWLMAGNELTTPASVKLAKARVRFSQYPSYDSPESGIFGEASFSAGYSLFRAGRADIRYRLGSFEQSRILLAEKLVRNHRVLVWKVHVEEGDYSANPTPLNRFLASIGYRTVGKLSAAAKRDLESPTPVLSQICSNMSYMVRSEFVTATDLTEGYFSDDRPQKEDWGVWVDPKSLAELQWLSTNKK